MFVYIYIIIIYIYIYAVCVYKYIYIYVFEGHSNILIYIYIIIYIETGSYRNAFAPSRHGPIDLLQYGCSVIFETKLAWSTLIWGFESLQVRFGHLISMSFPFLPFPFCISYFWADAAKQGFLHSLGRNFHVKGQGPPLPTHGLDYPPPGLWTLASHDIGII